VEVCRFCGCEALAMVEAEDVMNNRYAQEKQAFFRFRFGGCKNNYIE
jgi:hypothetical protein